MRGSGDPDVAADGEAHADVAGQRGEAGTDQEEDRPAPAHVAVDGWQDQQHEEDDDGEDAEGPELAGEVGRRAFLYGLGDLLHLLGALARRRAPRGRGSRPRTRATRADHRDHDDDRVVAASSRGW